MNYAELSDEQLIKRLPMIYKFLAWQGMEFVEALGYSVDNPPHGIPHRTQQLLQFLPHGKELLSRDLVHYDDDQAFSFIGFTDEARYIEISAALAYGRSNSKPDIWRLFQDGMLKDEFTTAVIESFKAGGLRERFIDVLTDKGVSDQTWQLLAESLGVLRRKEHEEMYLAKERKRKKADTRQGLVGRSTKDILLTNWIQLTLWSKSTSGILLALPVLQSAAKDGSHERDSRKVNKALIELGLTHPKYTQDFR